MGIDKKPGKALLALTSSAMLLPAYQSAADTPPQSTRVSYRYSQYQERDLALSQISEGSTQRYDIDAH